MTSSTKSDYYVRRAARHLRGFDRLAHRLRPVLARDHGDTFADVVLTEARDEYRKLLPELPYIGGLANVFTPVMIVNGWIVALFRAMQRHGRSAEDTVRAVAEVSDSFFRAIPGPMLRAIGRLAFSPLVVRYLRKQADASQTRRYPEDFVYRVHEGDGEMALEFEECAVNKFYAAQSTTELAPYCNFFDVTYSRLMGMGVNAEETIGLGCARCRLRYAHGRETVVPKTLEAILPNLETTRES